MTLRRTGFFPGSLASINTAITLTPFCQCAVKPFYDKNNGKLTSTATIGDCPVASPDAV
jgi:hypothetical protein